MNRHRTVSWQRPTLHESYQRTNNISNPMIEKKREGYVRSGIYLGFSLSGCIQSTFPVII